MILVNLSQSPAFNNCSYLIPILFKLFGNKKFSILSPKDEGPTTPFQHRGE